MHLEVSLFSTAGQFNDSWSVLERMKASNIDPTLFVDSKTLGLVCQNTGHPLFKPSIYGAGKSFKKKVALKFIKINYSSSKPLASSL